MSQERRRSQRIAVQQAVFITLENGGRRCTGSAENVSSGGVFLYSDYFIPAGAEVRLTLVLPPEITHGENVRVWWVGKILRARRGIESDLTSVTAVTCWQEGGRRAFAQFTELAHCRYFLRFAGRHLRRIT